MGEEIKILCVDDEPGVLNALRRLFLDEDYTFLTAASGPEGLEILEKEQEQIQLVISDYRMPAMNGVEFLNLVYKSWPQTVRIVLSGYADTASVVEAINEGHIYKFIPKPWNDEELKVTVKNALEWYHLHKKNIELADELSAKNEELSRLNSELKSLLREKNRRLEVRGKGLSAHQKIMDALPVGIAGLDFNNVITFCNATWLRVFGAMSSLDINETPAEDMLAVIKNIKTGQGTEMRLCRDGICGRLTGSLLGNEGAARGIILVFIPEPVGV